jgi:hypothetical protein
MGGAAEGQFGRVELALDDQVAHKVHDAVEQTRHRHSSDDKARRLRLEKALEGRLVFVQRAVRERLA